MEAFIQGSAWLSPIGLRTEINRSHVPSSPYITIESLNLLNPIQLPRIPDIAKACIAAVQEAIHDAGLPDLSLSGVPERAGLVVGNNLSSLFSIEALQKDAEKYGPNRVNPAIFPNTVYNSLAGYISMYTNIKGTNTTLSGGAGTVPAALLYALQLLQQGRHDRVIVCNVHLIPPEHRIESELLLKSVQSSDQYLEERITVLLIERPGVSARQTYSIHGQLKISPIGPAASLTTESEDMDLVLIKYGQDKGGLDACEANGCLPNRDILQLKLEKKDDERKKEAERI